VAGGSSRPVPKARWTVTASRSARRCKAAVPWAGHCAARVTPSLGVIVDSRPVRLGPEGVVLRVGSEDTTVLISRK
jgi:hypothetical protein